MPSSSPRVADAVTLTSVAQLENEVRTFESEARE